MQYLVTSASGFERQAKDEILNHLRGKTKSLFLKGLFLLKADEDISKIKEIDTTYIGHIYPIQKEIGISKSRESLKQLSEEVNKLGNISGNETFAVVCERRGDHEFSSRDVAIAVGNNINFKVDLKNPDKVVSIQIIQDLAFISVVESSEIIQKQVKVSRKYEQRPLNRAEFKLREAIDAFKIELDPTSRALDVGAAPGGWTKVLSEKIKEVVAIDPGNLEIEAPNIKHLKIRTENLPKDIGKFDIIVNDMNLDPVQSSNLMCNLAKHLKPKGIAIMTIKFTTAKRKQHIMDAQEILSKCFQNLEIRKLPHNRFETTIFMKVI